MRVVLLFGAAGALALTLAACGGKPSAVAPRDQNASYRSQDGDRTSYADRRDTPVPQVDGKPMWAANRKHTAEENAQYQFAKNGGDFGASSESEYVTKVHAFVDRPPSGAETLDRRNGDKLIYDAKINTFAVVSRDGAPRTMFKPRAGASYWAQQKDREDKRGKAGGDGGGGGSDQS
ncbi:MAG: hypothetical protein ABI906_01260 [Pseudomonadota bacterium]